MFIGVALIVAVGISVWSGLGRRAMSAGLIDDPSEDPDSEPLSRTGGTKTEDVAAKTSV
jgi:hypothetical protein